MIYRPRHSPRSFDKNSFEFLAESRGRLGGEDKRESERGREEGTGRGWVEQSKRPRIVV